jgi:hypothetical protein
MKRINITTTALALAIALSHASAKAQTNRPKLHVNPRWKECSFQLDSSLTQPAWRQFTREAGLVAYFRPLDDAEPMGRGNFEVSMVRWKTGIHDRDDAWNDTFVHPDSTHWLFEGSGLKFPGLMLRAGVTGTTDVGLYFTKNPRANYGFLGGQLQQRLAGGASDDWAVSTRASVMSLYGPEDLDFSVYGGDVLASKSLKLGGWATVSPYAGVSIYLASSHEKSPVVNLDDERVLGAQANVGAAIQISKARLAAEYNMAAVRTFSLKVGIGR